MAQEKKQEKRRRSLLSTLLIALFLLFALTSGMVGYLLGKGARPSGELIDTIVLSPGTTSQARPAVRFLTGRVRYRQGGACAGATVRLSGSQEDTDVTDENGKFYFAGVQSGVRTLEVVDGDKVLASMELSLDFSQGAELSADPAGVPASFRMPADARMLELTLTVEEDQSLTVEEDSACFVTQDGQVVNFNGGALRVKDEEKAVTPAGNLVVSTGEVLLLSQSVFLSPEGKQWETIPGEEVFPGVVTERDGTALIEEQFTLRPNGAVLLPGGQALGGGDKVVSIVEEQVQELETLPDQYVPSEGTSSQKPLAVPGEEIVSSTVEPEPESSGDPSAEPSSSEPASEADTNEAPKGGLAVVDKETQLTWAQESFVDLFKNRFESQDRSGGGVLARAPGSDTIAPGDRGYYEFRLKNPEEFDIAYTITIQETAFHIPILYSVVDAANNYHYLHRERSGVENALSSPEIRIPAGTEQEFRIEWEWQYEDWYYTEENDALDTLAGTGQAENEDQDRTYMISMFIHAAQVPTEYEDSYDNSGLQLPGKR